MQQLRRLRRTSSIATQSWMAVIYGDESVSEPTSELMLSASVNSPPPFPRRKRLRDTAPMRFAGNWLRRYAARLSVTRFRRGRLHGPDGRENDIFKRAPADLLSACGRFVPKTMQRYVYCVHVSWTVQYRCFLGNQLQQRQNSRSLAEPSKSVVVCCSACCYLTANDICRVFYYSPGFDKPSPDVVFVSFILITRRLSENPPAYHLVHLRLESGCRWYCFSEYAVSM